MRSAKPNVVVSVRLGRMCVHHIEDSKASPLISEAGRSALKDDETEKLFGVLSGSETDQSRQKSPSMSLRYSVLLLKCWTVSIYTKRTCVFSLCRKLVTLEFCCF